MEYKVQKSKHLRQYVRIFKWKQSKMNGLAFDKFNQLTRRAHVPFVTEKNAIECVPRHPCFSFYPCTQVAGWLLLIKST